MDLLDIKGRIAVALVESVFLRAGFTLGPAPAPEPSVRPGREELIPDFGAHRPGADPRPVEVRYRAQIGQYLAIEGQRGGNSVFAVGKRQWPNLLFVFVTDHPEAGRSCFQVVDLGTWAVGNSVTSRDLYAHDDLRIFRQNVEEHEALLRRMFALLTGG